MFGVLRVRTLPFIIAIGSPSVKLMAGRWQVVHELSRLRERRWSKKVGRDRDGGAHGAGLDDEPLGRNLDRDVDARVRVERDLPRPRHVEEREASRGGAL